MPVTKQWPSGTVNATPTSYQLPLNNELNWLQLSSFLQSLADSAQGTTFQKMRVRTVTATPDTVNATVDCILPINVASAAAINLPAGLEKQVFFIFDASGAAATNNITITPNGAETVRGAASLVLNKNYQGVILAFTGTDWKAFGPFITPGSVTDADFSGVLTTAKGGTGQNSTATFPGSGVVATVPAAGVVKSNGTVLSSSNVNLASEVTGVLPTANGGTGQNSTATFPASGAVAVVPAAGVVKSNGTVLSSSNVDLTSEVTGVLPNTNTTATSANTASAIVARDGSGNFSAGTITASLSGNATTATSATTAGNVSGVVAIANGGSGQNSKTPAFDALSPLTTKGDIIAFDGTNNVRFPVGANGTVLTANSATATGLEYTAPLTNPMTTQGDIIYGGVGGAATRLPAGTTGQALVTNGTSAPSWGNGLLPLGAVIATFPHMTGAYSTVATTNPDSLGFVLCQGQTLASGPMSGQVVPNINNNAFLRGNSSSSATLNSSATRTLAAANIPSLTSTGSVTSTGATVATNTGSGTAHSHSASGLSNSASSVSGSISNTNLNHSHDFTTSTNGIHDHGMGGTQNININGIGSLSGGVYAGGGIGFFFTTTVTEGNHNHTGTTGGASVSMDHNHGFSLTANAQSISGSVANESSHTHSIPSLTVNSGQSVSVTSTGTTGTAFNIEPTYINCVYLMRAS